MAKITPLSSTSAPAPRRTGPRAWVGRLQDIIDRLFYQLIRMPSGRTGKVREAGKEKGRH